MRPNAVFREHKPLLGMARENAGGSQSHRTHTECSEELPSTDPTGLLVLCRMHAMLLYGGEVPIGSRDCRAAARPVHKAVWQVFLSPPARVPRESTVKMSRLRAHARPV